MKRRSDKKKAKKAAKRKAKKKAGKIAKQTRPGPKKEKKGTPYEKVVAEIMQSFGNVRDIRQGEWVRGPDGMRDRDVSFVVLQNGKRFTGLIECKDYDPRRGKIGIAFLDALDSKRRDLRANLAWICTNAGFTEDALNKAARVGITAVAALRMGDERLKFKVRDTMYFRRATVPYESMRLNLTFANQLVPDNAAIANVSFEGRPVMDWIHQKMMIFIAINWIVNGQFRLSFSFEAPITFSSSIGEISATAISFEFAVTGAWYERVVQLDVTNGFYDWARRRMRAVSAGEHKFQVADMDWKEAKFVNKPPPYVLEPPAPIEGEGQINLLMVHSWQPTGGPIPNLDAHVVAKDKDLTLQGLDEAHIISTPGFVPKD